MAVSANLPDGLALRWALSLLLLFASLTLRPADAVAESTLVLHDPPGDGDGPGTYRLPRGPAFRRGGFDLEEVRLEPNGDIVEITLRFASPPPRARGVRVSRDEVRDLLLVATDIYVDRDHRIGSGFDRGIPGRRIRIASRDAWDTCIVVSDLDDRVAGALRLIDPAMAAATTIVRPILVAGNEVVARVPMAVFGGAPNRSWGYVVTTAGLTSSTSLRAQFLTEGDDRNVYTREVTYTPGSCGDWEEQPDGRPCTFGGCDPCEGHPRVLDALVGGPGGSREQLRRYRPEKWAELRAFVPAGRPGDVLEASPPKTELAPPSPPTCRGGGRFPVRDVADELVTVVAETRAALDGVTPGRIGTFVDATGATLGRGMVVRRTGTVLALERIGTPRGTPSAVTFDCPRP